MVADYTLLLWRIMTRQLFGGNVSTGKFQNYKMAQRIYVTGMVELAVHPTKRSTIGMSRSNSCCVTMGETAVAITISAIR